MRTMYEFGAPYGKSVKYITIFTVLFLAGMILFFLFMNRGISYLSAIIFAFLAMGIIFFSYAFSPMSYTLNHKEIKIKRMIRSISIPLSGVKDVKFDPQVGNQRAVRLFGSGGLFGYYGRFRSSHLGVHYRYVTDTKRSVLIYADKTYVISPDKPEMFVDLAKERINKK